MGTTYAVPGIARTFQHLGSAVMVRNADAPGAVIVTDWDDDGITAAEGIVQHESPFSQAVAEKAASFREDPAAGFVVVEVLPSDTAGNRTVELDDLTDVEPVEKDYVTDDEFDALIEGWAEKSITDLRKAASAAGLKGAYRGHTKQDLVLFLARANVSVG